MLRGIASRGRGQEGSLRARASLLHRPFVFPVLCIATWRRCDLLSFSATTPRGPSPWFSNDSSNFSNDEAHDQTFRNHQDTSCSSRSCYSASAWQVAGAGAAERLLLPKAPLYVPFTLCPPGTRTGRTERNQAGQLYPAPSLLPHLPWARAEVAGGSPHPQNLGCKCGPGCWVSRSGSGF